MRLRALEMRAPLYSVTTCHTRRTALRTGLAQARRSVKERNVKESREERSSGREERQAVEERVPKSTGELLKRT